MILCKLHSFRIGIWILLIFTLCCGSFFSLSTCKYFMDYLFFSLNFYFLISFSVIIFLFYLGLNSELESFPYSLWFIFKCCDLCLIYPSVLTKLTVLKIYSFHVLPFTCSVTSPAVYFLTYLRVYTNTHNSSPFPIRTDCSKVTLELAQWYGSSDKYLWSQQYMILDKIQKL